MRRAAHSLRRAGFSLLEVIIALAIMGMVMVAVMQTLDGTRLAVDTIHNIIYDELVQGIINPGSREQVLGIIARMSRKEAVQGVIAGCTEIELLVTRDDLDVPYFPTTTLHARHAANFVLGQSD